MSDEDEYYDDTYEEEWLYWDEGDFNVVDDIAIGTVHSPVYITDQALYAALESESDWDYYTDEYYDDDPSLLKRGQTALDRSKTSSGMKRKRKSIEERAKATKLCGSNNSKTTYPDVNSFRGVVWRMPSHALHQEELHEAGKGETVSLLKNWRELFTYPDPKPFPAVHNRHLSNRKPGRPSKKHRLANNEKIANSLEICDSALSSGDEEDVEDDVDIEDEPLSSCLTPPPCHFNKTEQEIIERSNEHPPKFPRTASRSKNRIQKSPSRLKQVTTAAEYTPPSHTDADPNVDSKAPTSSSTDTTLDEKNTEEAKESQRPRPPQRIQVVVGPPKNSSSSLSSLTNDSVSSEKPVPLRQGRKRKASLENEAQDRQSEENVRKRGRGRPAKTRGVVDT
ncbi:hypothetical protein PRK78_001415 [Emydomyces testavorans]|uniref:Uncharacterized protein n=1 Tax=Emydomyces testavorans TaxID=2070801 RepID=A0AAF0DCU7_9EURO|nr:hypothetical protein PRK78_001415 [Emydomyces testavorans]